MNLEPSQDCCEAKSCKFEIGLATKPYDSFSQTSISQREIEKFDGGKPSSSLERASVSSLVNHLASINSSSSHLISSESASALNPSIIDAGKGQG